MIDAGLHSAVGSACSWSRGRAFKPQLGRIIFFEIDHKIVSTYILLFLLIQEGQLSVVYVSICPSICLLLKGLSLHRNGLSELPDRASHDPNVLTRFNICVAPDQNVS